ncbi:MAG: hypothetical protein OEV41_03930, partial [Gammaproteobacteria bacterium]|nr:hypothetical protein [Gammaproteobacteria bacterium]
HIFLQLGMWQDVANSNIDAYAAALEVNEKYGLPEGREDFHTLSWLAYARLMLGQYDEAESDLSKAAAAVDRNPGNARVLGGYLEMRGRHMIETGHWELLDLAPLDTTEGQNGNWVAVVGMSAAHHGDADAALAAEARLRTLAEKAEAAGDTYDARQNGILELQVGAIRMLTGGDHDGAADAAKRAAEMEVQHMRMPSGPPRPLKPAGELYADVLMAVGRTDEAIMAYERSLEWIPLRTPSMRGLALAAETAGDADRAGEIRAKLKSMPGARPMD